MKQKRAVAEMKIVKPRGLRVYINTMGLNSQSEPVMFYSQRADSSSYRWLYEPESGQWCCSRVQVADLTLRALSNTNWQVVPVTLRARLNEHYLEQTLTIQNCDGRGRSEVAAQCRFTAEVDMLFVMRYP